MMHQNNSKRRNLNAPGEVRKRIRKLKKELAKHRALDALLREEQRLKDALKIGGWR